MTDITPKEAHNFIGVKLGEIEKSIEILERELAKHYFIKRLMISEGKAVFSPEDYSISEYVPEQGVR